MGDLAKKGRFGQQLLYFCDRQLLDAVPGQRTAGVAGHQILDALPIGRPLAHSLTALAHQIPYRALLFGIDIPFR